VFCMTIETGIGGALFFKGELYRGVSNRAGEFGHAINKDKSENILNNTYNYTATMRVLRKQFSLARKTPFNEVSGEGVFQAFDKGDQDAKDIISNFYEIGRASCRERGRRVEWDG